MASSGRQSRPERRVYAFGSCTPRTLSYLDNIPKVYRVYNAKIRRSARSTGPTLKDYMREARQDVSPVRRRDRSLDSSLHNKWAFGSSTPRELSYLKKIKPEYRVYDVKLEGVIDDDRRSQTTTFAPTRKSSEACPPVTLGRHSCSACSLLISAWCVIPPCAIFPFRYALE